MNSSLESPSGVTLSGDIFLFLQPLMPQSVCFYLNLSSLFSLCGATFLCLPSSVLCSDVYLSALLTSAPCASHQPPLKYQFGHLPFLVLYMGHSVILEKNNQLLQQICGLQFHLGSFSECKLSAHICISAISGGQPCVHALLLMPLVLLDAGDLASPCLRTLV